MLDEKNFLEELATLMNTEAVLTMDTVLLELEDWDSMSHVAFAANMSAVHHKKINPADARQASTVSELYNLVK